MNDKTTYLSVSALNDILKAKLESDPELFSIHLKGEISGFKINQFSGHAYFNLKDSKSVISGIMWSNTVARLRFAPKDGDEVVVTGRINVYSPSGKYSIVCSTMELAGQGDALLKLQMLAKKLQAEGLFDESRKRSLPRFPKTVGLITAKGSAAIKDMVVNIENRWPLCEIYVFPSSVQGSEAPKELLEAVNKAASYPLDVLIIGRGGGSSEDLWAFNDEALVRALAKSKCPTISAVGHEIDVTLTDYVADKRVSTPTGAAIAAVPDKNEIYQRIDDRATRLENAINVILERFRQKLEDLSTRPFFVNPKAIYSDKLEDLREMKERLDVSFDAKFKMTKESLSYRKKHLNALSPYGVLSRGYSITSDENGNIVKSVEDVKDGSNIKTTLSDGIIVSKVEKKEKNNG
ncbi:MAG: exodeoxyribonuclease VII large subunit [Bacilli bacterium]|nr:exodeoxyribonuclease VII large subunit [Bacilli bacterium]